MESVINVELNNETYLKLEHRAKRAGLSPVEALQMIALKGVDFFLGFLVGATKKDGEPLTANR